MLNLLLKNICTVLVLWNTLATLRAFAFPNSVREGLIPLSIAAMYIAANIMGILFGVFCAILEKRKNDLYSISRLSYSIISGCCYWGLGCAVFGLLGFRFVIGIPVNRLLTLTLTILCIIGGFILANITYSTKGKESKRKSQK
jgi:amino acid transporter